MKILFWDIDGTLINTNRAGTFALQEAATTLFGPLADWQNIKMAGMTDRNIAQQIIQLITCHDPTKLEIKTLLQHYEAILPKYLANRQGKVLPSVLEILTYLQQQPNYLLLLLTGNTYHGALAKLTHFGLADYFDFSASAFGDNCFHRAELALEALEAVQNSHPFISREQIFVIGDTPNDIHCGQTIGAKTIAVATGPYPLAELIAYTPWWALETLPTPAEFDHKLQEADSCQHCLDQTLPPR